MRLDVALMNGTRLELALDDQVRFLETGRDVAERELDPLGHVRRLGRRRRDASRDHAVLEDRRVGLHGIDLVDDVRQHLVVDLDQLQRLTCDRLARRRDGGHGMALEEGLLARQHVAHDVAVVDQHLAGRDELRGLILEVVPCHDGLDASESQSLGRVNRLDAGVGVRRAQHLAHELAGHLEVGAVERPARHLVGAVRTNRPRADDVVFRRLDAILHDLRLPFSFQRPHP